MIFKPLKLIVLAAFSFSMANAHATPWLDSARSRLHAVISKNLANQSQVGLVVGLVDGDQAEMLSYGDRVRGMGETPEADAYFEMGSITKTFTATLLALEVTRGRVSLADRVDLLWPELKGTDIGAVTLEQLATHTSGLPRMPNNFTPSDPQNPYKDYDEPRLFAFLRDFKFETHGPHPYAYSNLGMGLLGHLLADKLNHQSYESYLGSQLLERIGLGETKVALGLGDLARAAQGYDSFIRPIPFWDFGVLAPAGALKTTVNDIVKYIKFNFQRDSSPLGQAAHLAQLPRIRVNPRGDHIGLAWFSGQIGNHRIVTHGGATGGYRADLAFDPENKLGVVVLSNTAVSPSCIVETFFEGECEVPAWRLLTPDRQQQLVGTYYSEQIKMALEVTTENGLLALKQGDHLMRLWAKSETEMQIPEVQAVLRFEGESIGKATGFALLQSGQTIGFSRLP